MPQQSEQSVMGAGQPPGAAPAKARVHPYDFRRPRLFAQDQMRVLHHVHEMFAREFAVYLSAKLRTIVDIRVAAVEQMCYAEYVLASTPPTALYVVAAHDMGHRFVFEIDPRLVIFIVEKLFGGSETHLGEAREVSRIEQGIMHKVLGRAFQELERAWEQAQPLHLRAVAFESNAEFIQIMPGAASAFVVSFEVTVYEQPSSITLCYPYLLLERMIGRSNGKHGMNRATTIEVPPAVRERFEEQLRNVTVEMSAELGRTRLPVEELLRLEEGDVILLPRRTGEPVQVLVDGKEKFTAAAGQSSGRRALRILNVLEPSEQEDHEPL